MTAIDISGNGTVLKTLIREGREECTFEVRGKVTMHFTTKLLDGTVLDSTRHDGWTPFELRLGRQFSLSVWEMAVKTMRVGEIASFHCDAGLCSAYIKLSILLRAQAKRKRREMNAAYIPHKGEEKTHDSNNINNLTHQTPHGNSPKNLVENSTEFTDKPVAYTHTHTHIHDKTSHSEGQDEHDHDVIHCGMGFNETLLKNPDLQKAMHQPLVFELELVGFEKEGGFEKEIWEMSLSEKRNHVPLLKEQGNLLYRKGNYTEAMSKYGLALTYIDRLTTERTSFIPACDVEVDNSARQLKLPLLLNYAACALKLCKWLDVISSTDRVLAVDPNNVKALFRRAQARLAK
eukprot:Ihof_evm10s147 gene=Ihof_evmTU10s147